MKSLKEIKIKELILHNFSLKILAVIIAIVSWIVIVNVDNPSQRKTISGITVNMINGDTLTDKGYIYQVESGASISIVVKAPQTVVDELKATDFYAYADLSERTPDSDRAPIYVSCIKEGTENIVDIVSLRTEYVQLSIDNRVDKECGLELNITGQPADGYVVGDYSISPTTIRVSGAESTVSRIATARLNYNVSSMTASIDDVVSPVFYDENGVEISSDKLELSRNNVSIKIEILPTKWVDVNYTLSGEPADGFRLVEQTANLTSVNVAAPKNVLDSLSSIDVPSDIIDISGAQEDMEFEIALMTYLPSGCRIVSDESVLRVQADIERIIDRTINLSLSDISMEGTREDYEYSILSGNSGNMLSVVVTGIENDINSLQASDLGASVSLAGRSPGTYTVRVEFNDSDVYDINNSYYVRVVITDTNATEETESADDETEAETTETEAASETE